MSWMNRLEPPEPEYSDEEWDRAKDLLRQERRELDWTDDEIDAAVDDYLISEKCDAMRANRASVRADDDRARRKEATP